jgi:hypothetical protein
LKPKYGAQLKGTIVLRVFTLANVVQLGAVLMMTFQVAGWRVPSYERCTALYDDSDLPHTCAVREQTFSWRKENLHKKSVSMAVLGFMLTLAIPRMDDNRIARRNSNISSV